MHKFCILMLKTIYFTFKRLYKNIVKSITNKLVILMLLSTALPLIFVILISYKSSASSMEAEVINSNEDMIAWASKSIDSTIKQLDNMIFSLAVDNSFLQKVNQSSDLDTYTKYEAQAYITNKLYSILYSDSFFDGIQLFISNDKIMMYLSEGSSVLIENFDVNKSQLNYITENKSMNILINRNISYLRNDFINQKNDVHSGVSLIRRFWNFPDKHFSGVIVLDINYSMFKDIIKMLSDDGKDAVFLFNKDGKMIYNPYNIAVNNYKDSFSDLHKIINAGNSKNYIKTKTNCIFSKSDASGNIFIVKIIPLSVINKSSNQTLRFSFLAGVVFIIISVLLSISIAMGTARPIIKLARIMKDVEQNKLDITITRYHNDEIGVLEKSFVYMISRIKELINTEYKAKIERRTAQLKALQAQVNPHFLYNTLQLIGGIAVSRNVPEIYTVIKATSDMFRYTIKTKEDLVTINQELVHLNNYLTIQNLRYPDKITMNLQISEEIGEHVIPKLCIQPIVENSFIHGLENKTGKWTLDFTAQKRDNCIIFIIEDNGIGIDNEKLMEINEGLRSDDIFGYSNNLGLRNVHSRIRIMFGNSYGVFIESEVNAGTKITVRIPAILAMEG